MKRSAKLTIEEAKTIALGGPTKDLTKTSKLPGYSFGLNAFKCKRGSKLREIEGSVCQNCYATKNLYLWSHVQAAQLARHERLYDPKWVEALVTLIKARVSPEDPIFRWHDSGDLMSVRHLSAS